MSGADAEDWDPLDRREVQTTPDGRYLVFASHAHLVSGDLSEEQFSQIFEYDAQTEELVRVSAGEAGHATEEASADTSAANILEQTFTNNVKPTSNFESLEISNDGGAVAFSSSGSLTESAVMDGEARRQSFYLFRSNGAIDQGRVFLLSPAKESGRQAGIFAMTPSGDDVFFETASPLWAGAPNTAMDVFDARVGGGFPVVQPPSPCVEEACLGAIAARPGAAGAQSASAPAGGNLSAPAAVQPVVKSPVKPKPKLAPKRCKRGMTLKRGRCVKSKPKRSARRKGGK
jgi:hypothetical protein